MPLGRNRLSVAEDALVAVAAAKDAKRASQIDRLLDVGVFAPLGLLLNREQAVTDLAAAGRKQVAFTRSLGRAALKGIAKGATPAATKPASVKPPQVVQSEIEGYESMTARELVQIARTCTNAQAGWLRTAESSGKARVTVLRALDERDPHE